MKSELLFAHGSARELLRDSLALFLHLKLEFGVGKPFKVLLVLLARTRTFNLVLIPTTPLLKPKTIDQGLVNFSDIRQDVLLDEADGRNEFFLEKHFEIDSLEKLVLFDLHRSVIVPQPLFRLNYNICTLILNSPFKRDLASSDRPDGIGTGFVVKLRSIAFLSFDRKGGLPVSIS